MERYKLPPPQAINSSLSERRPTSSSPPVRRSISLLQYNAAYEVLENMKRDGVPADCKTISTIVFGCLKGGMANRAVEVVLHVRREKPVLPLVRPTLWKRRDFTQRGVVWSVGSAGT